MARLTRLSKELRCPECHSTSIHTRLGKKPPRVCRRCGYEGEKKEFEINRKSKKKG